MSKTEKAGPPKAGAAGIPDPDNDRDEEAPVKTVEFDDVHNSGDGNGEPPARKVERMAENTSTPARSAGQENGHPIPPARCSSSSAPNNFRLKFVDLSF